MTIIDPEAGSGTAMLTASITTLLLIDPRVVKPIAANVVVELVVKEKANGVHANSPGVGMSRCEKTAELSAAPTVTTVVSARYPNRSSPATPLC